MSPIKAENRDRKRCSDFTEPLFELLGPDEAAALLTLRASLRFDATKSFLFWESIVARLTGGTLTSPGCAWDVELRWGAQTIRIEVKYSLETLCRFANGTRPIFKFSSPRGEGKRAKPIDVLVCIGLDTEERVHAWVSPARMIRASRSITLTSPRVRKTGHDRSALMAGRCPVIQVLPEVLRAYRANRAPQSRSRNSSSDSDRKIQPEAGKTFPEAVR